ncbi:hypothetical protein EZS27_021026 [termite gut metagenome]|uniref:DUF3408 domain-containing protein n=1 Tax=termite gut metagenome TaxID=433724 RepID=A0A5J4RA77_9ZZZZ
MEKKLTKDMTEKLADFPIEDYFGIPSKVVNTGENAQSADLEEQAGSDVPENPTATILTSQTSMPSGEPSNHVPDKPAKKTVSTKDRKNSLAEYQETFLAVPRIIDRKNVFISNSTREMIVGIVRRFGGEKTSVSGFLENLALHHFEMYGENFETWKKLFN